MSKRKIRVVEDLPRKDILSLYDRVLPLLYNNPSNLNPLKEFIEALRVFISFDNYHFIMDDQPPQSERDKLWWTVRVSTKKIPGDKPLSMNLLSDVEQDDVFEKQIAKECRSIVLNAQKKFPGKYPHYCDIVSDGNFRIAFGFFRFGDDAHDKEFTVADKKIIKNLSTHIFTILRTVLLHLRELPSIDYYATFMKMCSSIAKRYDLSQHETLFLPEILFGFSNEEIAKRNFVSVPTVKTHIRHIFKKTGSKNRVDFISKFFTSPYKMGVNDIHPTG